MYLSKLLAFVITLLAAAGVAVSTLVPLPATRELAQSEAQRLDRAQHSAELWLKMNARLLIDTAAKVADDAVIVENLEALRGGRSDADVHKNVQERLRYFNMKLKATQVLAVDLDGRVIARLVEDGGDEREWRDSVAGVPLIAAALRGYRADDTWIRDGKMYRVAATPVFARSRDRYVGALVLSQAIAEGLANEFKQSLDADVAFLARGKVVASSLSTPALNDIPKLLERRGDEMRRSGRTPALELAAGDRRLLTVIAPLRGEAAEHGAAYAILAPKPNHEGVWPFLSSLTADDLESLPWGLLVAVFMLGVVGTVVLHALEAERPLSRLRDAAVKLADGSLSRLDDATFPGRFGAIARSINATLDERERRSSPPPPSRQTLAPEPVPPRGSAAIVEEIASPPPLGSPMLPQFRIPDAGAPPSLELATERGGTSLPPPPPIGVTMEQQAAELPVFPGARLRGGGGRPPPPPAPALGGGPAGLQLPAVGEALPDDAAGALAALGIASTPPTPVPPRTPPPAPRLIAPLEPLDEPLAVPSAAPEAGEADHFQQIYQEFLDAKRRCGEPTDNLTFEKFSAKLRGNRDELMKRFGCRTVRFQVYVKDGKAALKATPVKDNTDQLRRI